jgi:ribosomal protein L24
VILASAPPGVRERNCSGGSFSSHYYLLGMVVAPDYEVGAQVIVIGGSYVGHCAVVIKVTKHMYKILLLCSGEQVRVMKWNVETMNKMQPSLISSLEVELDAMKNTIDVLLEQIRILKLTKDI